MRWEGVDVRLSMRERIHGWKVEDGQRRPLVSPSPSSPRSTFHPSSPPSSHTPTRHLAGVVGQQRLFQRLVVVAKVLVSKLERL